MSIGGLVFSSISERRPFGNHVLAHPLIVSFAFVGVALLVLRFSLRRPVTELISDRTLLVGCGIGIIAFLVGNWFGTHLGSMR